MGGPKNNQLLNATVRSVEVDINGGMERAEAKPRLSTYGGLILGNSTNEVKGFTDKPREIFKGSIPFKMPV